MARAENKESAGPAARTAANVAKRLRRRKGLTQEQLGRVMGYTGAAVSAMETLSQPVSDEMLVKLDEALGDGSGIFEELRETVRLERLPRKFRDYLPIEQKALSLYLYANHVVHGLFQTERYARALIAGGYPTPAPERVEELVEMRMARKDLFDRQPLCLVELVLDESALRRPLGSREIMREQLEHLAACSGRQNVNLYVLPLDAGLYGEYAGARGELNLVETPENDRFVYLDVQDESMLITVPSKVSTLAHRHAKIRAQALDPRKSLGLIRQLAGEGT
ncbi:helix-turn-helix transcriptional regulator [Streptomyces sp. NPDC048604]|uniref:helix-turn-helix domain-containing protein n=1 Tax=Streptomyces sp. NPDC048604 TaxID=3365578 RepID=UPI0037193DF9